MMRAALARAATTSLPAIGYLTILACAAPGVVASPEQANQSASLAEFHFLRPHWLLALLPCALLLVAIWRHQLNQLNWRQAIDPDLLAPLLEDGIARSSSRWPLLLTAFAWLTVTIALAGPTWQRLPQPVFQKQEALIIALDLSPSMYAGDVKPSRLEQARREVHDVLRLRRESGGSTALIVYSGDAHVVTPLTEDTATIALLLPSLNPSIMPQIGNQPLQALKLAADLASDASVDRVRILLITDGLPADDFDDISAFSRNTNYALSILGIGTEAGAPIPLPQGGFLNNRRGDVVIANLNQGEIKPWADAADIRYRHSHFSDNDVEWLLRENIINNALTEQTDEPLQTFDSWRDFGPWLALLLVPVAALGFRRGWLLGLALAITLPHAPSSHAMSWQDLWRTGDQQGQRALQGDDPEQAAEQFNNEQWRGVARYHAGDYQGAAEDFASGDTSQSNYNRGNALAMAGDLEAALEAYERALELDPDNNDAAANQQQVKALMEQQKQPQQSGEDGEKQQGNEGSEGENNAQTDSPQPGDDESADTGTEQDDNAGQAPEAQQQNASQPGDPEQTADTDNTPDTQQNPAEQQAGDGEEDASEAPGDERLSATPTSDEPDADTQHTTAGEANDNSELQQWLRQIPDEPGKLLQRKFEYQYRLQHQSPPTHHPEDRY